MRNKHNTKTNQTKRPAHIQMLLTGLTIALVAFASGFFAAAAHVAAVLTNHE
jgi:hypothetical protein